MSGDGEAPLRLMLPRPLLQPASASPDSMEAVGPSLVSGEDDGSTEGGSHHHHREHRRQGSGSISTNNPLSAQDELSGPEEEAAKCQVRLRCTAVFLWAKRVHKNYLSKCRQPRDSNMSKMHQ